MSTLALAGPAQAQLGTSANPPPRDLFRFKDVPPRRDDGLGTMAERRRALARHRARHPTPHPTR